MIKDRARTLNKIADQIRFLASEMDAGETIDTSELVMIARRIDAQAEMLAIEAKPEREPADR